MWQASDLALDKEIEVTQSPHRGRSFFTGVVLLQTALLLASAVMVPATAVAQDPLAPAAEQGSQPAADASPEPSQAPAPEPSAAPAPKPSVEPEPEPSATPKATPEASRTPAPVESVAPSSTPDESPSTSPGTSASPEPSPSDSVDVPTPTAPADPPANKERNRVTVVAAADIDGNGKLDDLVTIESPPGTILRNVHAVPVPTDPAPPSGIVFPAGLFDYEVVVAKPGDPATVTFHLPDGTVKKDVDTGFWVLQNGRWSDLTARADADHVTDKVTVKLVDGGAGDQDRHADGVIADPGGPGVPRTDWTLTLTVRAPADPTATFNYFLEECTETSGTTGCTPQAPRQWVDWVAVDGPTLPGTAITPVTLSDGQTFTWANLDADRHYRMIEVGTDSPPDTGTGTAPAGWAITGFACESVGRHPARLRGQLFHRVPQHGRRGVVPTPGWSDCTVANSQIAEVRSGSTITAHKVGDRSAIRTNQPLQGATMGLWRDVNGDGNFQPGGADGNAFMTCVTAANGACDFTGLAAGGYWVQEVAAPTGGVWNAITEWGPGSSSAANPAVPYAAVRNGDPAATLSVPVPTTQMAFR